jgi:hypothetical protein
VRTTVLDEEQEKGELLGCKGSRITADECLTATRVNPTFPNSWTELVES